MPHATLVDVGTLAAHLGEPGWRVFDCRCSASDPAAGEALYLRGHLPGARHADLDRVLAAPPGPGTGRHPLPDREDFAAWLGTEGVGNDTQVVAYDDAGGAFAARLWWLMRWMGHEAVAVLDGGLQAWQATGGALETDTAPLPEPAHFEPGTSRARNLDTPDIAAIVLGGRTGQLIDARNTQRYHGESEPIDPVAGHIPGAANLPYSGNLDRSGLFLPAEKLRERFQPLARDPGAVVHYCGSGVTACHNVLAMEHAGLKGSHLYPGSWSEWIRDPTHPVEKP